MKTKQKLMSNYQKTQLRMQQESGRALARVKFLENLYKEMVESRNKKIGSK